MRREAKEIILTNLGLTPDPDRTGMFNAILEIHNVELEWEDGAYTLVLSEETIFDDLYNKIAFGLKPMPGHDDSGFIKLRNELTSLDVL